MKEITYLQQQEKGPYIKSGFKSKFLFPMRGTNYPIGPVMDVKVEVEKERFGFFSATPVKMTEPSIKQLFKYCEDNDLCSITISDQYVDMYGNKFLQINGYNRSTNMVDSQIVTEINGSGIVEAVNIPDSNIHGVYYDKWFHRKLETESLEVDPWEDEDLVMAAGLIRPKSTVARFGNLLIVEHHDVFNTLDHVVLIKNKTTMQFTAPKDFLKRILIYGKYDVTEKIREIALSKYILISNYYSIDGYHRRTPRRMHGSHTTIYDDILDKSKDDDLVILGFLEKEFIYIFDHYKDPRFMFACINNSMVPLIENLYDDEYNNIIGFLDYINDETNRRISKLAKQSDPKIVSDYLYKNKLWSK